MLAKAHWNSNGMDIRGLVTASDRDPITGEVRLTVWLAISFSGSHGTESEWSSAFQARHRTADDRKSYIE